MLLMALIAHIGQNDLERVLAGPPKGKNAQDIYNALESRGSDIFKCIMLAMAALQELSAGTTNWRPSRTPTAAAPVVAAKPLRQQTLQLAPAPAPKAKSGALDREMYKKTMDLLVKKRP